MTSPIVKLLDAIASSPFRVAPEAATKLNNIVLERSLSLELHDDSNIFAELIPSKALIRLGVPFLEVLWSAAHAYIVIFHEYQQASARNQKMFDVGGTSRTEAAYRLYRELLQAHATCKSIPWPTLEIVPIQFPREGTDAYVANEIFLVAISWIIHHEIAHARLEHQDVTVASIQQESEADQAATRWVCEGTQETRHLHKRSMGIVTAILVLLAYDIEAGRSHSKTHPPSFERLILNLDATGIGEDEMIYAFTFVLLEIHLAQSEISYEVDKEGTFRDMCVSACFGLRNVGMVN